MSLAIEINQITHVLLADGWHEVTDGSFDIAPYEFGRTVTAESGEHGFVPLSAAQDSDVHPVGFAFTEARTGASICGPLTSVIAVRREQP